MCTPLGECCSCDEAAGRIANTKFVFVGVAVGIVLNSMCAVMQRDFIFFFFFFILVISQVEWQMRKPENILVIYECVENFVKRTDTIKHEAARD